MTTETTEEIVRGTGRALRAHGYADLTMQDIAEESAVTTAAIHYHFDTKEALLNAFLDDLIERFERRLASDASDPRERLATLIEAVFQSAADGDDAIPIALLELEAQAPYHEGYRERFVELDRTIRDVVATAVHDGVDAGYFPASADPAAVARVVSTAINGGHVRAVALGEAPVETRRVIERYLELELGWVPDGSA